MLPAAECAPIVLAMSPEDVVRAWPAEVPLAAMISGFEGRAGGGRSRWSILAIPRLWSVVDPLGDLVPRAGGVGPLHAGDLPFVGGWMGVLTYELGACLEPSACARNGRAQWPLGAWARCESALVHDAATGRWWAVGDADELPCVERLLGGAAAAEIRAPMFDGPLRSEMGREAYVRAVARAVEYIRAGDVFQVNLSHALVGTMRGTPRGLFASLLRTAAPWYGALLEVPAEIGNDLGGCAVVSASPELFLEFDARTRRAVTRPMKGTRGGERTAAELLASEKDAAELNMIVDLMRNDLGRVCAYGSVRVECAREVEAHGRAGHAGDKQRSGGVLQGVATVSGTLREGLGLNDLLRATFPPGSITGAPKVRAMQIIDELEARPRGPYCGCVGYVSDCGRSQMNVAIRTVVMKKRGPGSGSRDSGAEAGLAGAAGAVTNSAISAPPRETCLREISRRGAEGAEATRCERWDVRYGVGAGIVADSDPASEWRETLLKARVWEGIAGVESGTASEVCGPGS
ncbi:MAG: anthranilate synthase component I family protein [Phycisphaeraceae bacterium]|nr:anthranilate synthase component I family protein [Phycisphaeraceae bacterium]